jgi:hypothetical protein
MLVRLVHEEADIEAKEVKNGKRVGENVHPRQMDFQRAMAKSFGALIDSREGVLQPDLTLKLA